MEVSTSRILLAFLLVNVFCFFFVLTLHSELCRLLSFSLLCSCRHRKEPSCICMAICPEQELTCSAPTWWKEVTLSLPLAWLPCWSPKNIALIEFNEDKRVLIGRITMAAANYSQQKQPSKRERGLEGGGLLPTTGLFFPAGRGGRGGRQWRLWWGGWKEGEEGKVLQFVVLLFFRRKQ